MALLVEQLTVAAQNLTMVAGIVMFVFGFVGNCLSILTFSSLLKTHLFPPTSTRLYLFITAVADLVYVSYLLSTRILIAGFLIPVTNNSVFLCKSRLFVGQVCQLTSVFSLSFAAIDQYCVTNRSVRIRRLSQLSLAKKVSFFSILLWSLINTPVLFLYNIYPISANSSLTVCTVYSNEWTFYLAYIQSLILLCIIPLSLMIIFGLLTRNNIRAVRQNQGSIARQMTRIILLQISILALSLSVATIQSIYSAITLKMEKNALRSAQDAMFTAVAYLFNYINYSSGFYIYLYSSKTLRQNLKNLLLNRQQNQLAVMNVAINQTQRGIINRSNQVQPVEAAND